MPSHASGPERARRVHFQSLRLTAGERAVIRARAHAAGLSVSAFLRRSALGQRVRARSGQVRREERLDEVLEELRAVLDELTG